MTTARNPQQISLAYTDASLAATTALALHLGGMTDGTVIVTEEGSVWRLVDASGVWVLKQGLEGGVTTDASLQGDGTVANPLGIDFATPWSADWSAGGHFLHDVHDPVAGTDADNKRSRDAAIAAAITGASDKAAAQLATTAPVADLAAFPVAQPGYTAVQGDRVVVVGTASPDGVAPASAAYNGIYDVGAVVAGLAPLTRSADADTADELAGALVAVEKGANADSLYFLPLRPADIVVDTTPLNFVDLTNEVAVAAPITKSGRTIGLAGTDVSAAGVVQHFALASDASAGGHKIDSLAAGTAATDAANVGQLASDTAGGAVRTIRVPFTTTGTYDSTAAIPAGATVLETRVVVTTAYPSGATITVGQPGSLTLLQNAQDNFPSDAIPPGTTSNRFVVDQEAAWGGAPAAVRVTVAGAASGAGFAVVFYATPAA